MPNIDYDNYIIAHHLDDRIYMIPLYPESIRDVLESTYQSSSILARTAPLQSWSGAGPRTVSFSITVHRDLDYDENGDRINSGYHGVSDLLEEYQALTLPNYSTPMLVVPPKITVRIGNYIRITGIPSIQVEKKLPVDENGRYLVADISIEVKELEPTDAVEVVTSLYNARGESRK